MAAAIAGRDVGAIRALLAPDFVHRTHGGAGVDVDAFIAAIEQVPCEIMLVRLERLEVDICGDGALVTGVQHAQVLIEIVR